jgi:hypothetical protein
MNMRRLIIALFIALSVILPAGIALPGLPTAPQEASASCAAWGTAPYNVQGTEIGAAGRVECYDGEIRYLRVCLQNGSGVNLVCQWSSVGSFAGESVFCHRSGTSGPYAYRTYVGVYSGSSGAFLHSMVTGWKYFSGGVSYCYT